MADFIGFDAQQLAAQIVVEVAACQIEGQQGDEAEGAGQRGGQRELTH
jgi:hypothetical protein